MSSPLESSFFLASGVQCLSGSAENSVPWSLRFGFSIMAKKLSVALNLCCEMGQETRCKEFLRDPSSKLFVVPHCCSLFVWLAQAVCFPYCVGNRKWITFVHRISVILIKVSIELVLTYLLNFFFVMVTSVIDPNGFKLSCSLVLLKCLEQAWGPSVVNYPSY